jgi:hypothetical protein
MKAFLVTAKVITETEKQYIMHAEDPGKAMAEFEKEQMHKRLVCVAVGNVKTSTSKVMAVDELIPGQKKKSL